MAGGADGGGAGGGDGLWFCGLAILSMHLSLSISGYGIYNVPLYIIIPCFRHIFFYLFFKKCITSVKQKNINTIFHSHIYHKTFVYLKYLFFFQSILK
jgi:hypothetical protein